MLRLFIVSRSKAEFTTLQKAWSNPVSRAEGGRERGTKWHAYPAGRSWRSVILASIRTAVDCQWWWWVAVWRCCRHKRNCWAMKSKCEAACGVVCHYGRGGAGVPGGWGIGGVMRRGGGVRVRDNDIAKPRERVVFQWDMTKRRRRLCVRRIWWREIFTCSRVWQKKMWLCVLCLVCRKVARCTRGWERKRVWKEDRTKRRAVCEKNIRRNWMW